MPGYEHVCPVCKVPKLFMRSVADCQKIEICDCGENMVRLFGFSRTLEFQAYNDPMDGKEIRTHGQEKKQLKKHGQVHAADTHMAQKWKSEAKRARKKPLYFT